MRAIPLVLVLVLAPLSDALTQQLPLQPGQRVRVTVPSLDVSKQQTTFQRLNGDTLEVSSASYVLSEVTRLDMYAGRKSHLWVGAGIGLLAGAVAGGVTWTSIGDCGFVDDNECRMYGALLFGGVGAVVGGVTGLLIKSDRWEEVPLNHLRVSVVPQQEGRFGFGMSINF